MAGEETNCEFQYNLVSQWNNVVSIKRQPMQHLCTKTAVSSPHLVLLLPPLHLTLQGQCYSPWLVLELYSTVVIAWTGYTCLPAWGDVSPFTGAQHADIHIIELNIFFTAAFVKLILELTPPSKTNSLSPELMNISASFLLLLLSYLHRSARTSWSLLTVVRTQSIRRSLDLQTHLIPIRWLHLWWGIPLNRDSTGLFIYFC